MRKAMLLVATVGLCLAVAVSPASAAPAQAVFKISSITDGKTVGLAALKYRAKRLSGLIVVSGLTPGLHAIHIHGPGTCAAQSADVIVAFPDIEADANGVAVLDVNVTGIKDGNPLKNTSYLNIHEKSSADGVGAEVVCGDVKRRVVITV